MDRFIVSRSHSEAYQADGRHLLWPSIVLICCSLAAPAQQITQLGNSKASFSTRATHLWDSRTRGITVPGHCPFRTIRCNFSRTGGLAQR